MKTNGSSNNWGCWIGVLILIFFIFSGVKGCITRSNNKGTTCVNVIDSNRNVSQIRIKDNVFIGKDTIYIGSQNVYQNRTGKDLVIYMVKYTSSEEDTDSEEDTEKSIETIIHPNEYFLWFREDNNYHMFTQPPHSTTVITRGRYGYGKNINFTYIHFLDFADNISDDIKGLNY